MWRSMAREQRCDVQLVVRATHISVRNQGKSTIEVEPELENQFEEFWAAHR